MVSSGEIIRKHCGHVAVCGSAIEAPSTEKGTNQPTPQGQDASLRHPGCTRGRRRENSIKRSFLTAPADRGTIRARHVRGDCSTEGSDAGQVLEVLRADHA